MKEQSQQQSQALESNASDSQSIVPDNSIDGEYVEPAKSVERKVEPISRAILSNPDTTMEHLHEMATHELDVLDALNKEGRQIIKTRLMAIWEEMSVRFERGESINGISGTGGKGMGKYLRSIGVDPAKRRSWKFEIRQQETLRLAQENPPSKSRRTTKKEIVINSETEADLIAKAGVRMAQKLVGDGMTPPQERINKAGAMAKDILEAIADGQYARLEPLPVPTEILAPETATLEDWQKHRIPEPKYTLKYFAEATENFSHSYMYSFQKSGFKKIIQTLRDKPDQVLSNATDFAQLATVLRGVAENANLLAAAISTALTPSLASETSQPEEQPDEQNADQTDSDLNILLDESEFESPTPAADPDAEVISTTKVGDKSEPTLHGFFFEMRLHEKLPYVVRDANNPNLGILCECKNKADAEMKVATYEREAAEAMAAAQEETRQPANQVATDEKPGLPDEPKATAAVVTHAGSGKQTYCGLKATKENPLAFVEDEEKETPTCAACAAEVNREPSEEDKAWLKKRLAAEKAKATRLARLPQSEHYRAEDKGFGHWLVIEKATGYKRDELFSSNRKDCQEWLEAMEADLVRKAPRDEQDYEFDKVELDMVRGQLAEGADGIGPLDDERRAEMVERIAQLEERISDYERKHPAAKALAAPVDGATTCENEVNSNEVV